LTAELVGSGADLTPKTVQPDGRHLVQNASVGQALGRWQQVLMEALAEHKAVGVRAVVVSHLGREATRAEIEAARRAAHLLERRGHDLPDSHDESMHCGPRHATLCTLTTS
jgi:hypothetical protein